MSTRSQSYRTVGPFAAAIASLAAVLSVSAPSIAAPSSASDVDGPQYQMPTVGECRNVTNKIIAAPSDTTSAIDCAKKHSALTIAVVELPEGFDFDSDEAKSDALATGCVPAYKAVLGQSWKVIAQSAYSISFYAPTDEQIEHGASWLRCDINLRGARKPLPLKANLTLPAKLPWALTSCILVDWDTNEGAWSSCGDTFNFRPEKVLTMSGAKYPTRAQWLKFASKNCPAAKQGDAWWSTWPGTAEWQAGNHYLNCYRSIMD